MITSDIVLGTKYAFGKEYKVRHGVLRAEWENVPLGTPIIFDENEFSRNNQGINALILISPRKDNVSGGTVLATQRCNVVPIDLEPITKNHKVFNVEAFEIGKMKRLLQYVQEFGSISFCIANERGQMLLPKQILKFVKSFRYNSVHHFNSFLSRSKYGGTKFFSGEDDAKLSVISIFNILYCIPIFNTKYVDGIGLSYNVITKNASLEYGQLHRLAQLDILLSNYEENIFVIDGSYLGKPWTWSDGLLRELHDVLKSELIVKSNSKPQSKSKKGNFYFDELKYEDIKFIGSADNEPSVVIQQPTKYMNTANEFYTTNDLAGGWTTIKPTNNNDEEA
jgi:hypothetical protein